MASPRLFCTFRLAGGLFGVDLLDVKEITAETTTTRVAHAPDEVLGLVNIRGHIYLALDLRRLLGLPASGVAAESRLVLFKPSVGAAFGVMVDEIADIQAADPGLIDPFSRADLPGDGPGAVRVELIESVIRLADELLVVLAPRRFLPVVERALAGPA
ncbi:chemotaxis protein CheW [Tautonia marina]|uniref:chemotaxis protein CheW n=1 Tax=Tautonia marina TaxID=2653855 RepID=UPI00137591E2|nr:chemotaxis protein CheW [Tautonia marina]